MLAHETLAEPTFLMIDAPIPVKPSEVRTVAVKLHGKKLAEGTLAEMGPLMKSLANSYGRNVVFKIRFHNGGVLLWRGNGKRLCYREAKPTPPGQTAT